MKRALVALAIAAIPFTAFATNKPNETKPSTSTATGVGVGVGISGSWSDARSSAQSNSVANGGRGGDAAAVATGGTAVGVGGSANAQGGSASNGNQSLTVNNVSPSDVRIRNTPSVNAWAAPPSASCVVTTGGAVNVPGFGGGLSTGTIDKQCEARENARFLANMGAQLEAIRVLCRASSDVAKEVVECKDIAEDHTKRENQSSRSVTPLNQYNMAN
jgi:hypothetical protein